jgi:nucleoside 2-deoxyribosyltransferase
MESEMKIFLAGTIDDGKSTDWQKEVKDLLGDTDIIVYNPRRYDFPEHPLEEDVVRQIRWEQEHLDDADLIVMNFLDGSLSPITLLEMGLYAKSGKLMVFCNENYWRYTNVKETCRKYHITLYNDNSVENIVKHVKNVYETEFWLNK